jgi:uncharacterized protein YlxW (UPF0749 family)
VHPRDARMLKDKRSQADARRQGGGVVEYTSGPVSWSGALRRAWVGLRRRGDRRRGWSLLVPIVALLAGMLFTTTANTSAGTELRDDRGPELANLIQKREQDVTSAEARAADLRRRVEGLTNGVAGYDAGVAEQRAQADAKLAEAGLTALHGPAVTVRMNDAPRRADNTRPAGATVNDLVVHQQDVQAVVNALWAGGAEAMMIMGVRIISTSAVRCVGNTLLLHGRVYSPPFVITAVGDAAQLQHALDESPGVRSFRKAANDFGLGYEVRVEGDVTVPAYQGSLAMRSARVPA